MSLSRSSREGDPLVRVGVGVFIFRSPTDNRFVFGLRKGSHGAGTWSLPGGHLEYGESFADCAIAETAEETGLEIQDVKYLTSVETVFAADRKHYVTIFLTAVSKETIDGSVKDPMVLEPDKCEEWVWKSFEDIVQMDASADQTLFEPMRSLISQRPDVCRSLAGGFKTVSGNR